MRATSMMTARQWTRMLMLGLALAVAIAAVMAVVLPAAALALGLAALAAAATLVAQQERAVTRAVRAAAVGAPADEAPRPTLLLDMDNGEVLTARPVPLPGAGEHTMVLTRDGYMLLGADGEVFYKL